MFDTVTVFVIVFDCKNTQIPQHGIIFFSFRRKCVILQKISRGYGYYIRQFIATVCV